MMQVFLPGAAKDNDVIQAGEASFPGEPSKLWVQKPGERGRGIVESKQ